jgi:hypothetical protein
MKELKIEPKQNGIAESTQNWVTHLDAMVGERISKRILQYKPKCGK